MTERRDIAAAIASQFTSRWVRGYVKAKLKGDPLYAAVAAELLNTDQPVLDIGCGHGLLAYYLREQGFEAPITGIDTDAGRISTARSISEGRYDGLTFAVADARRELAPGFNGSVVLADVLHYMTDDDQHSLLLQARAHVAPGGCLIIRDCLRDGTWRYRATWLEESFARLIGWLKVPMLNFPRLETVVTPFRGEGFAEEIRPLWGRSPYNNYLFVFRRDEASRRSSDGMTNR